MSTEQLTWLIDKSYNSAGGYEIPVQYGLFGSDKTGRYDIGFLLIHGKADKGVYAGKRGTAIRLVKGSTDELLGSVLCVRPYTRMNLEQVVMLLNSST